MSMAVEGAIADYLGSLGMTGSYDGGGATCRLENDWLLHLEPKEEALRVVMLVPRDWDLDVCAERALRKVNLIGSPRFSPATGLYRDQLLFSLNIEQNRCTRAEITDAVTFLMRLGEACVQ